MAPPTRPQIEAAVTVPAYTVEVWDGSAWAAVSDDLVLDVTGAAESAGGDAGLTFGAEATAQATIRLDPAYAGAWDGTRVRVRYGFGASDQVVRVAGIVEREEADAEGITWRIAGWDTAIARTPVFTPLYHRRPASTATSAGSVEDPTSPSHRAGLVNTILWQAGGRPYDQAASYPTALFFPLRDTALIVPEWSWAAGENAWDELGRLARACGLVIHQAADGVVHVQHALTLAGSGTYPLTAAVYGAIQRRTSRGETVAAVRCAYTARALQPTQPVYTDTTPRLIPPTATIQITLDMTQPVGSYVADGGTLPEGTIVATTTEGIALGSSATILSQAATRLTIQIGNPGNATMVISQITIQGQPLAPTDEGQVTVGSGTPERAIGSDTGIYVQSRSHAERLCVLYRDVYGTPRSVYTLSGCAYDPDRAVGEAVRLTGLDAVDAPGRITAIRHADTGATMELDVVRTDDLPTLAGTFVVGQAYAAGDVRALSY